MSILPSIHIQHLKKKYNDYVLYLYWIKHKMFPVGMKIVVVKGMPGKMKFVQVLYLANRY